MVNPNMAIYDVWQADDGYSMQGEEVGMDIVDWPDAKQNKSYTLRLEEFTHFDVNERVQARARNLARLEKAKQREDISHLEVHYTCCVDKIQRRAIEALLTHDKRQWLSFTMQGINGLSDFYARPAPLEELMPLFLALQAVEILNLHSCTLYRGHGLDEILKALPHFRNLRELRLQGWQMDRISVSSLIQGLQANESKTLSLLSLRSCAFMGEGLFDKILKCLGSMNQLKTLNMSYCNLRDAQIIPLIETLREHESLENLHIGGNECGTEDSVALISTWIQEESCRLRDLNLRALWIGFSEEGLLQRPVDLSRLFDAVSRNHLLHRLTLSENYLENSDLDSLAVAVKCKKGVSHLDVGDNPFTEKGAAVLLDLVTLCPTIESIRFENHFMPYRCAEAVKVRVNCNYFERRLTQRSVDLPLPLWPQALSKVQQEICELPSNDNTAADIVFHLIQSTTGNLGLPLSYRLAQHHNSI